MGALKDVVLKVDSKIPWQKIVKRLPPVVIGLAFLGLGGRELLHLQIQKRLEKADYVLKSMELVKGYKYTEQLIGTDLCHKRIPLRSDFIDVEDTVARFIMPVCGKKGCVTVYCWSRRDDVDSSWEVHKLDMELASGERWTFFNTDSIWGSDVATSANVKLDRPSANSSTETVDSDLNANVSGNNSGSEAAIEGGEEEKQIKQKGNR